MYETTFTKFIKVKRINSISNELLGLQHSLYGVRYFTLQHHITGTGRRFDSAYIRQVNFYSFYLEMADALWEGHTPLKTGLSAHRHTHRHTKVKTIYLPVSLRSLGGYNKVN